MSNRFLELFSRTAPDSSETVPAKPTAPRIALHPSELLELVNQARPNATKGIPEKQALAFVSAVLDALGNRIDAAGDSPLRVPGLGVFRSREVEVKVNNEIQRTRATGLRRVPSPAPTSGKE